MANPSSTTRDTSWRMILRAPRAQIMRILRSRSLAVLLAVFLVSIAGPAIAHSVTYTHRESGQVECGFQQPARTDILAVGHARHTWYGRGSAYAHNPTTRWYNSSVVWDTWFMEWRTANQQGWSYSSTSSGGGCSA